MTNNDTSTQERTADPPQGRDTSDSPTSDDTKTQAGQGRPSRIDDGQPQEPSDIDADRTVFYSHEAARGPTLNMVHLRRDCAQLQRCEQVVAVAWGDLTAVPVCQPCQNGKTSPHPEPEIAPVPDRAHDCPACALGFRTLRDFIEHLGAKHPDLAGRRLSGDGTEVRADGGQLSGMERVTIRMPTEMLDALQAAVDRGEFPSRSEAIRAAVREEHLATDGGKPGPLDVEIGDRVTYYDSNANAHRALVLDGVPNAEYITVVYGADDQLGEGYNHAAESQSSVYPHTDLGDEFTADTLAFKPGWDA